MIFVYSFSNTPERKIIHGTQSHGGLVQMILNFQKRVIFSFQPLILRFFFPWKWKMDEHGLYLKGKDPTGGSHLDGKKGAIWMGIKSCCSIVGFFS